jgi:lysophospholipase L1-like esterase
VSSTIPSSLRTSTEPASGGVAPRRASRRGKILYAALVLVLVPVAVELLLRLFYGASEMRQAYNWYVGTHLVDLTYPEFLHRQERILAARAALGMERGRSHPLFGWTYNPTFRIDVDDLQIHINSHALRGEEFPEKKPPGEVRILCLGGSTTAGEEVGEAETYPAQLQAILRARYPGLNLRVINAGVPSYDVPHSLRDYELRLYRFEPDVVTIYHGINDLYIYHTAGEPEIRPEHNYTGRRLEPWLEEVDPGGEWWFLRRLVVSRSYVLRLVVSAYQQLAPRASLTAPDPGGIASFTAYYRALVRQIRASGATPVAMTFAIAYPGTFDDADAKKIRQSFGTWLTNGYIRPEVGKQVIDAENEATVEVAREESVSVCDIASAVPPDREHFIDVCHLRAAGNRRIAETLAQTLAPFLEARGSRARGTAAGSG